MEATTDQTCLIVGASHGGVNAAFNLRRSGWAGRVVLVDRDPELPYHRPPLSKAFLSGEASAEDNPLKAATAYEQDNIELRLGASVTSIDRERKTATLAAGETLSYDHLVLATGATPFLPPLPGIDSPKVFPLRTAADAQAIHRAFAASAQQRVVIVGGGYIGLEAAASLRKLGGTVTVIEREDRILARVTAPELSTFFTELHEKQGVRIVTSRSVSAITEAAGELTVACADGSAFSADLVIVGVGVRFNTGLAAACGLTTSTGIHVDEYCRTDDPNVYAIGDCTRFRHPRYERELHLESVQNAVDQSKVVAANICGQPTTYDSLPWFWSDQYDVKLQIVGLSTGYDQLVVRAEDTAAGYQRSYWYFCAGELLAVDAVNNARAYMLGTKLLKAGQQPDPAKLADPEQKLHPKTILRDPQN